jgi:hypothetical protein
VSRNAVDVDDVAVDVVGFHDLDSFSGGNAQAQDVQIQGGLPIFGFAFCQSSAFVSTGVVDKDMDRSYIRTGPLEGLQDVFFFSDVSLDCVEFPFLSRQLFGMFFDELRTTSYAHHLEKNRDEEALKSYGVEDVTMRPCSTREAAMALPIPELAPVTMATLSTHLSIERTMVCAGRTVFSKVLT